MSKLPIINVPVKILRDGAKPPVYSSEEAAGADLCAIFGPEDYNGPIFEGQEAIPLKPGERRLIKTGIAIELLPGFEAQIRPRSGLALKHGITVLNSPGTIDSDYRGEIGVILFNSSGMTHYVNPGDRIAQLVVAPVTRGVFEIVTEELSTTERGEGGFGSTGTA